ncbi:ChaB family protein [Azoarcus sp. KH32C]|uniref:ChaB family protein n=1 Tax=Azoarcus sp. KH32C TaxID=748247 RepID=UPI00034CD45D|nr:ChaB family protein [Azoarcus sp. KH32C]
MPNKALPSTLKRSSPKAQRTYAKTLENAEREYGSGERASRTAIAALKHSFEKVGDHWEKKDHKGPSDPGAEKTTSNKKQAGRRDTYGGVDVLGHTYKELYERARDLDIRGRGRMNKEELARAIASRQR